MNWMGSRQAARALGMSERTLRKWRAGGVLKPGEHYRRKGPNARSELIYNVQACEAAMGAFTTETAIELGHV